MQNLFDDNDRYTHEADSLDNEAYALLKPLMEKYCRLGYSVRQIEYVMTKTVADVALGNIL